LLSGENSFRHVVCRWFVVDVEIGASQVGRNVHSREGLEPAHRVLERARIQIECRNRNEFPECQADTTTYYSPSRVGYSLICGVTMMGATDAIRGLISSFFNDMTHVCDGPMAADLMLSA